MSKEIIDKERELERLTIQDEIEGKKMSISQKKSVEKQMRKAHGKDWKKVLGVARSIRPNREALHDLYSVNPELKELNRPRF